ncbi:MAG: bifunctional diaminohydroxyphosphoribosylaminopyrimidine deaminase/5-amino-6-(5-phosphoribosylamino)uracil reductase RibD [Candidatus Omnitrophica bacterium]|nr:bifunctional diaminohydroxyphosphoribosylaminopyrimidine deaminase/5-amino-6-(5-phosphoribosylamino)uracil reductase RibD [Candidatus Omnitrophota bacterium]
MNKDLIFLKKALELAQQAEGLTSPNPLVGAVIVKKGKVVSKGYHRRAGLPHAEVEAIKKAKADIKGATLYIGLEPCCHFGKTPPCVDKIIASGIKRVVIATLDPNPIVSGKSVKKLKKAGIQVSVGLHQAWAQQINEVFFKNMAQRLPFVVAKAAQSLDGKTATKNKKSKWITSDAMRLCAKKLRDKYDAVLVGINTVCADNPSLDGANKTPFKVVIDPHLRISSDCKLIKNNPQRLIIFTSKCNEHKAWKMPDRVNIFFLEGKNDKFALKDVLKKLYKVGIRSVFVEGGSQTLGEFFDSKLVDKVYFFIAPKIIGGKDALVSVGGEGASSPNSALNIRDMQSTPVDNGILISGYPT